MNDFSPTTALPSSTILGMQVHRISFQQALEIIVEAAKKRLGHYVCIANVHMCFETRKNPAFKKIINHSLLTLSDGRPLVWAQKLQGHPHVEQIRGPDLSLAICEEAQRQNLSIGFYGGKPSTLEKMVQRLTALYPRLKIGFQESPPFHPLTPDEKKQTIEAIKQSHIDILFVGLGCPKQETWMAEYQSEFTCIMIGIGAAFDYFSGEKKQAPKLLQTLGLEWLFRLIHEPTRLWKRYLKYNPLFLMYLLGLLFKRIV